MNSDMLYGMRDCLRQVYEVDASGDGRKAAQILMFYIITMSGQDQYDIINEMFMEADLNKMSSRSMVAMIRSCWVFKSEIIFWQTLYLEVWKQLLVIGSDPRALFIGMVPPDGIGDVIGQEKDYSRSRLYD